LRRPSIALCRGSDKNEITVSDSIADPPEFRIPDVLAKELARFLQDQIVFGDIAPGMRFIEEDIVRRYNVSRSPVREAFRLLEQDGLLVRDRRRGVRVGMLSVRDLDEIYACRIPLEGMAAETAAQHRTDAHLPALEAAMAGLQDAFAETNVREYFEQNVRLTDQILLASGNATLRRLLGTIGKQALRYRYLAYCRNPNMMQLSVETNREIIDAILHQRGRTARTLTEDLIQQSWQGIRNTFADE
jgi:DNA-binding GntR family transcriptional regulator